MIRAEEQAPYQVPSMSDADVWLFAEVIRRECGIAITAAKKNMLSARLARRLRALGMSSFRDYYKYISAPSSCGDEVARLVDVVTTNTTEFFRERKHFDFLVNSAMPSLPAGGRLDPSEPIRLWSAGCSSGEEPYTIAMVLAEYFAGDLERYMIYGTDISSEIIDSARRAVYSDQSVAKVPTHLRQRYMMRGKGRMQGYWRMTPEIRDRVSLSQMNLLGPSRVSESLDVIFCRNALIYFDTQNRSRIVAKFHNSLRPGGFLFIGHSESLNGINDQFVQLAPTIYTKQA